jgi:hypothetical protein
VLHGEFSGLIIGSRCGLSRRRRADGGDTASVIFGSCSPSVFWLWKNSKKGLRGAQGRGERLRATKGRWSHVWSSGPTKDGGGSSNSGEQSRRPGGVDLREERGQMERTRRGFNVSSGEANGKKKRLESRRVNLGQGRFSGEEDDPVRGSHLSAVWEGIGKKEKRGRGFRGVPGLVRKCWAGPVPGSAQ